MILRGDVAPARLNICTGDVLSTVTVGKFEGFGASGERQELVAETHAENWLLCGHRLFNIFDGRPAHRRIARAVGEHKRMVLIFREIIIPRHADDSSLRPYERTHDIFLGAAIDEYDFNRTITVRFYLLGRHFGNEIFCIRVKKSSGGAGGN